MPPQRNRSPTPIETDDLQFFDDGLGDPTIVGQVKLVSDTFRMRDTVGVFNPRSGEVGDSLAFAVFKIDGGLVYDSNGHPQVKLVA